MGTVAKNFPCGNEPGGRASQVSLRRLDFGSQRATKSATRPIVCDYVLARVSCVLPWWWWRRWCVRRSNMATRSSCQWPCSSAGCRRWQQLPQSALPLWRAPRRRAMHIVLALLTCAHMYRVLLCCSPGGGSGGGACDGPTWPHGPAASGQRRCQQQLPGVHCLCRPRPVVAPCASHSPCSRALACVVCAAAVQYGHSTATARPHSTASAAAAPYGQPQYGQPQYGQ